MKALELLSGFIYVNLLRFSNVRTVSPPVNMSAFFSSLLDSSAGGQRSTLPLVRSTWPPHASAPSQIHERKHWSVPTFPAFDVWTLYSWSLALNFMSDDQECLFCLSLENERSPPVYHAARYSAVWDITGSSAASQTP